MTPSSVHSNVEPTSEDVNSNVADVAVVVMSGAASIVVSGGPEKSTVQLWLAGVASPLSEMSTARTRKVCAPAARPV